MAQYKTLPETFQYNIYEAAQEAEFKCRKLTIQEKKRNLDKATNNLIGGVYAQVLKRSIAFFKKGRIEGYTQFVLKQLLQSHQLDSEIFQYYLSKLRGNNKNIRTFLSVITALQPVPRLVSYIFVKCMEAFLSPEGESDFNDWVDSGKLKQGKGQFAALNCKEVLVKKFQAKFQHLMQPVNDSLYLADLVPKINAFPKVY